MSSGLSAGADRGETETPHPRPLSPKGRGENRIQGLLRGEKGSAKPLALGEGRKRGRDEKLFRRELPEGFFGCFEGFGEFFRVFAAGLGHVGMAAAPAADHFCGASDPPAGA